MAKVTNAITETACHFSQGGCKATVVFFSGAYPPNTVFSLSLSCSQHWFAIVQDLSCVGEGNKAAAL